MNQVLKELYSHYGGFWRYPKMLDFCYLVNPYFSSSAIVKEMQAFFPTLVSEYPSGMAINSALASECWGVKPEYIVPGNGAAELIKTLMENLDGKVGVVRPTFEEYPNRLPDGMVVDFVPDDKEFRYSAEDLIEFYENNPVETLLLINPDNPSGNFIPVDGIHKLVSWCETNNVNLILDESFVDFTRDFEHNSLIDNRILEKYPRLVIVKSISKSYGVPGLRLGILCSSDTELIAKIKKQVSIWNINSFAEFFMQLYPKYRGDYKEACIQLIQTREDMEKELRKISYIHVMPSQANFFFIEVLPPYKPLLLCELLLEKYSILTSACLAKKGISQNRYLRVAIRNQKDNEKLVKAFVELENTCHLL